MIRVLIVDDEALARSRLALLVHECSDPRCVVVGECADSERALQWLREAGNVADALLLDIQMPGRNGTALAAELLHLPQPPAVVFVTAHAEHALAAFDLEAVDYLTKPVRRDRLQAAMQRVARRLPAASDGGNAASPVLVVSERGRVARVPLHEVLYLKAELKYVTLRTATRTWVLDDSLADLEHRLGERFIRVHRNALVARDAVRSLERHTLPAEEDDAPAEVGELTWAVQVAPLGEWLAVSRRQLAAVREALAADGR